jgi:hypothetical protein
MSFTCLNVLTPLGEGFWPSGTTSCRKCFVILVVAPSQRRILKKTTVGPPFVCLSVCLCPAVCLPALKQLENR